jgi:hypothetical protein
MQHLGSKYHSKSNQSTIQNLSRTNQSMSGPQEWLEGTPQSTLHRPVPQAVLPVISMEGVESKINQGSNMQKVIFAVTSHIHV